MCQFKEGMWERDGVREGAMRRKVRTQIFREGGGYSGKGRGAIRVRVRWGDCGDVNRD